MPALAASAALNFLKETKGALTWTSQDFARGVGVKMAEAAPALAVLQMQGYVKAGHGKNEWMTTLDGDAVSGAMSGRFSPETVKQALTGLRERIKSVNKDARSKFRITGAVAFGDFLSDQARVQAADVGIALEVRTPAKTRIKISKVQQREFFKALRAGKQMIHLLPFEPWMRSRRHLRLL